MLTCSATHGEFSYQRNFCSQSIKQAKRQAKRTDYKQYLVSSLANVLHQTLIRLRRNLFVRHHIRGRVPRLRARATRGADEMLVHILGELQVVDIHESCARFVLALLRLAVLPLFAEVLDLVDAVLNRVVVLAGTPQALPDRQMARVYGDTVVLCFAALAQVSPSALLLLEIKTRGVWEESPSYEHACKTEPWDEIELLLCGDVVVDDTCE